MQGFRESSIFVLFFPTRPACPPLPPRSLSVQPSALPRILPSPIPHSAQAQPRNLLQKTGFMTCTNSRKPLHRSAETPCKASHRRREAPPLPPHRRGERGPAAVEKPCPNCALSVLELCPNCAKAVFFKGSALPFSVPKPFGFGTFLLPQSPVSALRKAFFGTFFCPKGYTLSAYTLYPFDQNTTTPSNDHPLVCGPTHYTLSAKTLLPLFLKTRP